MAYVCARARGVGAGACTRPRVPTCVHAVRACEQCVARRVYVRAYIARLRAVLACRAPPARAWRARGACDNKKNKRGYTDHSYISGKTETGQQRPYSALCV